MGILFMKQKNTARLKKNGDSGVERSADGPQLIEWTPQRVRIEN